MMARAGIVVGAVLVGGLALGSAPAGAASAHVTASTCRTQVFTFKSGGALSLKVGKGTFYKRAGRVLDDGRANIGFVKSTDYPYIGVNASPLSTRTYTGETRIVGVTLHYKSGKVAKVAIPSQTHTSTLYDVTASYASVFVNGHDSFGTAVPFVTRADITVKESCFPKVAHG